MATAVNLPPTLGGFTFKGIHSSKFGVRQTPGSRVLMPAKRRSLIEIPGRSESFVQEDGGYQSREESITCSYAEQHGVDLQRQVRLIAGWLDGIGELTYDYEPEMHYMAYLSSAPPTVKMLQYATFELSFTMNHPFAYETATQQTLSVMPNKEFTLTADGTTTTPFRFIIKNTGTTTIKSLVIQAEHTNDR